MESRNPVFRRTPQFTPGGSGFGAPFGPAPDVTELEQMYAAPPATAAQARRMTLDDVVMRTASLFGVLLLTAAAAWVLNFGLVPMLAALVAGLVLGMVITFRRTVSPALVLVYAAVEGVFVGTLSHWYTVAYGNQLVPQAVLGTLAAFVGMLLVYRSGRLRATPKFTRMLLVAGFGYLGVALVSLVSSFFGVGGGWGFYGVGPLGVLLSVAGVALAALYLILDFDFVEQGVRNGLPERESWRAAFGLLVTLVWLYLEILRLLAILNRR